MKFPTLPRSVLLATLLLSACGQEPEDPELLHRQAEVDRLAATLMDDGWTQGLVIGLLLPGGETEFYAFGTPGQDEPAFDRDTLFEVGSVTKSFTGLALADMASEGSVDLDQPVQELLPAEQVTMPFHTEPITLTHLASHTSGLPYDPTNLSTPTADNPSYASYTADDLYTFLNGHTLEAAPGPNFQYSNLGFGLLGHGLARTDETSWEELIASRITRPLGLDDTVQTLSPEQSERFAQGHDGDLHRVMPVEVDVLAGCIGLRSTASDLLTFVAAQSGSSSTDLSGAMTQTHQRLVPLGDGAEYGLGWEIQSDRFVWHGGATFGAEAFAGFDPETETGVVVLANTRTSHLAGVLLGWNLMMMVAGEEYGPPPLPPTLEPAPAELEKYLGHFVSAEGPNWTVTQVGDHLVIDGKYQVYASAEHEFYSRARILLPVYLTFGCVEGVCDTLTVQGVGGTISGLTWTGTRVP